jgi:hypothetical protein
MPTTDFGFFRRTGATLTGSIGRLRATWDRHRGGLLSIRSGRNTCGPLTAAARVTVICDGRAVTLAQESDPDPRLVICEEGPERIAMRTMFSLLDEAGVYHGDGLTDAILYADGEVRLAFGLRLVDPTAHQRVTEAGIQIISGGNVASITPGTAAGAAIDATCDTPIKALSFKRGLPKRSVVLSGKNGAVGLGWCSGEPSPSLGGVGMWHGQKGPRAPYYDTWGHLYCQWNGMSGWAAHPSGRLLVSAARGRVHLGFRWLHLADEPAGEALGMRSMLGLFFAEDAQSAARRLSGLQNPLLPRVSGAEFRCLDAVENALLYRKTDDEMTLAFPRDRLERTVRVRVFGLDCRSAVAAVINDRPVMPHVLTEGGQVDDPYGPNLARPGDRLMPLVGDPAGGPIHAVVSVPLSASKKTTLSLSQEPGVQMAYVKWDDRQIYAVRSSSQARPLAIFSSQTLCLHDIEGPAGRGPALTRLPFYWYPTNVQTRGECFNELRWLRVGANGPGRVAFRITSTDPNARADSIADVTIPAGNAPVVKTDLTLRVRKPLDLPEIQFLNAFAADSRLPEDWPTDWVILLSADGGRMATCFKEPRKQQELWSSFTNWKKRLVMVQGASERGNIFLIAENRTRHSAAYVLCRCWLDSHFMLDKMKTPLKPGTVLKAGHTLAIFGDQGLSRDEAAALAEQALKTGSLPTLQVPVPT